MLISIIILHFFYSNESSDLLQQIKQEYKRNSRIERFMNPSKSYSIEQSYINLAIVKAKEQHEKEKQFHDAQDAIAVMDIFEEIYGAKTAVDIKDIFETCEKDVKQVLVFGRAGIGKSTFCRYVAYQWAMSSYWPDYELLALIPLRHLTIHRYPPNKSYSLIDLIKTEVLPLDLTEREEELLKKQFDAKKTLWVLDGYDEIIQNIPPHLQRLFEQLLKTPHHIITSRPYLNTLSYNVQMEITGFTDANIKNYVQNFFEHMKDELEDPSLKSGKLLNFLRLNRSIWGVAHVPVNLELICSLWSNEDWLETEQITVTKLYTMMIEWLCRRYLRAQYNQVKQLSQEEIDRCCQNELTFLESLAFNAMESNTILVRPVLLKKALHEAKISLQEHPDILNIGVLKSFHQQGVGNRIEMNKTHYFVHLSFQEYFAARCLISAFCGSETKKAIEFIKYQKYNQRYTLVFTFAAGLLSERGETFYLNLFWNTILNKPLDLVGIRHMQLVISCMKETAGTSTLSRRSELLEWIAQCIEYNITTEGELLYKHLIRSLQRAQLVICDQTIINMLINLVKHKDVVKRVHALSCIFQLQISNPSTALITSVIARLDDENEQVRMKACYAAGTMVETATTNEVISKLLRALEDQSEYVRLHACTVLGNTGEKGMTNEVISKVLRGLDDQSDRVRQNACVVLGKMGEKAATNEVITRLVSALRDKDEYVKGTACAALGNMGEKAATKEVISRILSALEDESGGVRMNICKAFREMIEKAVTNEVITTLLRALKDQKEHVREGAYKALASIGEKAATNEVISTLVSALEDESKYVRLYACTALGNMGKKAVTNEVISKLVRVLEDKDECVKINTCYALGNMGEKAATNEVINSIVNALQYGRNYIRMAACEALGKMGEKAATNEVITQLVSALRDKDKYVKRTACTALGNMGEKAATNEVINSIVNALQDEQNYIRMAACETLGKMGEKAATNEVITQLVSALRDKDEYVKRTVCAALGNIGEKAATNEVINSIVNALQDEQKYIRMTACVALGKMGEKAATNEVITQLVSALRDKDECIRRDACAALGNMGKKAVTNEVISRIVDGLKDENSGVRLNVCKALGKMGDKVATHEVIKQLVNTLEDEDFYVRRNACKALGNMGEKAATHEVISKLVAVGNNSDYFMIKETKNAVANILSSSAVMMQLDPKVIAELCLCDDTLDYLTNITENDLVKIFLTTKNTDWLSVVIRFTLLKGTALTVTEDRVVIYSAKEPSELLIPSSQLRDELINAFTDQRNRLHLYFETLPEARK